MLVVGLDPAQFPDWDPTPIQAAIDRGRARFVDLGIEADWCLVTLDDAPEETIVRALSTHDHGCVVIGGGIREHEPLLEFFERVVNLVHHHSPGTPIAFDTTPEDCADAALRWLR